MHNARNRLALSNVAPGRSGHRSAKGWASKLDPAPVQKGSFMLRDMGEPGFPEDILVARPPLPGARIVVLPDTPAPKAPAKKKAIAKPKRKTAKRKTTDKGKVALKKMAPAKRAKPKTAKMAKAKAAKSTTPQVQLPSLLCLADMPALVQLDGQPVLAAAEPRPAPQLSAGLLFAAGMAKVPASVSVSPQDRVPILVLPRNRSLAARDQGVVSRLINWLGSMLPRKRKHASLPRSRQKLNPANLHK